MEGNRYKQDQKGPCLLLSKHHSFRASKPFFRPTPEHKQWELFSPNPEILESLPHRRVRELC